MTQTIPDRIIDGAGLSIFDCLASMRIRPDVKSRAKFIARKGLYAATSQGLSAKRDRASADIVGQWQRLSDTADQADKAIELVLRALDVAGNDAAMGAALVRTRHGGTDEPIADMMHRAAIDIDSLKEAKSISKKIVDDCRRRIPWVKSQDSRNAQVEKNAFIEVLAETWTFLTGKVPGARSDDPFLDFAHSGWFDWKQTDKDESFVQATRLAIAKLDDRATEKLLKEEPWWLS